MMRLSQIFVVLFMAVAAVSCQDGTMQQTRDIQEQTYKGIIPCADCPGIAFQLTLKEDGQYQSSRMYIGESSHRYTETGTYEIKNDTLLALHPEEDHKLLFSVEKNRLTMLDQEGNRITGSLAEYYILHRADSTRDKNKWQEKRAEGIDFRASGNEPFWGLNVDLENSLTFHLMGGDSVSIQIPEMKADTSSQARYWLAETQAGTLKVEIAPVGCLDSMSGHLFDYGVSVSLGGQTYQGCGGFINSDARLNEFWSLHTLKDSTITVDHKGMKPPSFHFNVADEKVYGFTGCNLLSGSFTVQDSSISFSKMITTKRACLDNNKMEPRFLDALQQVETYQIDNARLYFLGQSDTLMVFRHSK